MYFIYCIECITPNHLYVGQTGHLVRRITNHKLGRGSRFTLRHGVKRWCVVTSADTIDKIKELEVAEYKRLKGIGYVVGGFSVSDGMPYTYAANELLINGYNEALIKPRPPARHLQHKEEIEALLSHTTYSSLRKRAARLGELINCSDEAAMSML